jgi:type II secretory pathway component PulF
MPLYHYEAVDAKGNLSRGTYAAEEQRDVILYLEKKGLAPISMESDIVGKKKGLSLSTGIFERVTTVDRIVLVRNLGVTLRAGLSILESIEILILDTAKQAMRTVLLKAKDGLSEGRPLSDILADFKKIFPPVFIGLLKAGESSGHLDAALEQLASQMTKEYQLNRKVKSALAYPMILMVTSVLVVTLLMVFILPRLTKTFQMSGVELPLITRIIVAVSDFMRANLIVNSAILAGTIVFVSRFKKTNSGRKFFTGIFLKLPAVKYLVKKVALVRLTRNLGTLIGSGINITEALQTAAETSGNIYYEEAVVAAIAQVKNGIPISESLKNTGGGLFPNLLLNMINVGERSGTLEFVLKTFADFYDEEVDNSLKDLTSFLEPVLLLFMGLVIGLIAISILLPIYQLVGKFS